MGLLKWKNEVGRGMERNALNRGRSILGGCAPDVKDGTGDRNQTFGIRDFNQLEGNPEGVTNILKPM
jgi:hypothetical protein